MTSPWLLRLLTAIIVLPLAGLAILSLAALIVKLTGYRPRGDVLAASSFGLVEMLVIYGSGFLPAIVSGGIGAALPPMRASIEALSCFSVGIIVGLSPAGWFLAANLVPPGNNTLVSGLVVLTSLMAALSWALILLFVRRKKALIL